MKSTEHFCPGCAKPIDQRMAFCRKCWFILPSSLRDKISAAVMAANVFEKSVAVKAALDLLAEKAFCKGVEN